MLFSLHDIDTLRALTSPEDGLALLEREPIDLVVQDMNFQRRHHLGRGRRGAVRARSARAIPTCR